MTEVSALVISWNTLDLLRECLASLRLQSVRPEIVVLDAGSSDGSLEWLREQPDIVLDEVGENLGFAAANNRGLGLCQGRAVLLVNADVSLAPDYIELCLRHLARPDVGSVTGKLLRPGAPAVIDSTGHRVYGVGWAENRGELEPDLGFTQPGEVFGVSAAAALYRREALDSVAFDGEVLDESYFSYIEDVDLDWRLRWQGWRAWFEPAAVAVHHRSATGARFAAPFMRHILKNRVLTVVKNYDGWSLVKNLPGLVAFTATKSVDFGRTHPSAMLGLVDAARLMPLALRRRRLILGGRRQAANSVRAWLAPFPWRRRLRRRLRRR